MVIKALYFYRIKGLDDPSFADLVSPTLRAKPQVVAMENVTTGETV